MQSMNDYYSAVQLRADRWSSLREKLEFLVRNPDGKRYKTVHTEAGKLFESLELIERYWAFPGTAAFLTMRRQFEHNHLGELSHTVTRVNRALSTGAYRRRNISPGP